MISIPSEAARWINASPWPAAPGGIMSGAARPNFSLLQCALHFRDGPIRDTAPSSARTGGRCNLIESCQ
jgi:hypothetical protein